MKFIGKGIKPEGPNRCVLNILRTLVEDTNSLIYIPQDYKYGTNFHSTDPKVHFNPVESGKPIKVVSLRSNQERYNFSVVGLVPCMVEIEDPNLGTVRLEQKNVWRTYNIIRDGNLVIDKFVCKLSKESFELLRDTEVLYYNGVKVPKNHEHNPDCLYYVKFDNSIPLISLNWAQPVNIGLYDLMIEEISISSKLSILKKLINEYKLNGEILSSDKNDLFDIYDEQNTYSPDIREDSEKTEVNCLIYRFPGIKSEDITIDDLRKIYPDLKSAHDAKKALEKELNNNRFTQRCVVYAIESSAKKGSYNWSEASLLPRSKDKYVQSTKIMVDDKELLLERVSFKKLV